jgi:hypothetical protein
MATPAAKARTIIPADGIENFMTLLPEAIWAFRGRNSRILFISKLCVMRVSLAIDHPGDAKFVDKHAEGAGPEGFLQRHFDFATSGEGVEDLLGPGSILEADRDRDAAWLGVKFCLRLQSWRA